MKTTEYLNCNEAFKIGLQINAQTKNNLWMDVAQWQCGWDAVLKTPFEMDVAPWCYKLDWIGYLWVGEVQSILWC